MKKFWDKYWTLLKEKAMDQEFRKEILGKINPEPEKGSGYLVDYMVRVLIFLFPLYIHENTVVLGLSMKDILFGIVILIMTLWCGAMLMFERKLRKTRLDKKFLAIIGAFFLVLICLAVQVKGLSKEVPHTYLYIGLFLLPFCAGFVQPRGKYYLKVMLASYSLVYLSIYRYIFTGSSTILGVEAIIKKSNVFIPAVMLSCAASAFLYITEDDSRKEKAYLTLNGLGLIILFLYGDMTAFMIMLLFIMGLQFLRLPKVRFIKKDLILVFLFAFCASNAPLLTFFKAPGVSKEFDLEYSIYIDIVIAVAGLLITRYWERIPKDHDEEHTLMTRFSWWYKRSILIMLVLLAVTFVFGSRGDRLSKSFGGKALAGFSTGLWDAINSSKGELWHVMVVYGLIGVVVLLVVFMVLLGRLYVNYRDLETTEVEKGYILIALLFIIQGFFYPFADASTPLYLIFVGLALKLGLSEREEVPAEQAADIVDLDMVLDGEQEGEQDKELQLIWIPQHVRASIRQNEQEEIPKKGIRALKRFLPQTCAVLLSVFSAALLFLVVLALYRVIIPAGHSSDDETLVEIAIEHRKEQKRLAAEAKAAEEAALAEVSADSTAEGSVQEEAAAIASATLASVDTGIELAAADASSEASSEEVQEEEQENAEGEEIEAGISHGDYRIYDPNAKYASADDTVTGRDGVVNLRSVPSLGEDSEIVHPLEATETVHRIAIGENGWSKVEYDGKTLYAVSEYLVAAQPQEEVPADQANAEAEAEEEEEEEEDEEEDEEEEEKPKAKEEKPKEKAAYTVQWSGDNKQCAIWSAGKLQGTMTISDGEGTSLSINHSNDHYEGSGKDQKKYLTISASSEESEPVINVDQGFIDAVRDMGYSGVYFNKTVHNW